MLFIFAAAIYILFGSGKITTSDSLRMFHVTQSIVETGTVQIPPDQVDHTSVQGVDGKYYSNYGILKSLANVPAYFIGKVVSEKWPRYPKENTTQFFVSQLNPLFSAGVVVCLFSLCCFFDLKPQLSVFVSLVYGFASIAFPYAKDDMSEPLATLTLLLGFNAAIRFERDGGNSQAIWSAVFFGLSVATRHVLATAPVIVGAGLLWSQYRRQKPNLRYLFWFFGILGAIAIFLGWFNFIRFGSFTDTGYNKYLGGQSGFNFTDATAMRNAFSALILSPGRGIFFYMPYLIIVPLGVGALFGVNQFAASMTLLAFCVNLFVVSGFKYFDGAWSWGPRLLLPFIPLLYPFFGAAFAMVSRNRFLKAFVLSMCLLAFVINTSAVVVPWMRYMTEVAVEESQGNNKDIIWSFKDSQIANQPRSTMEVLLRPAERRKELSNRHRDIKAALERSRSLNLVNIWWVRLVAEGILPSLVYPVVGILSLIAAIAAFGLPVCLRAVEDRR
jgi:hypothetical protein